MALYFKINMVVLVLLLMPLSVFAAESALSDQPEINAPLTLPQVIRLTLERNLNLRAEQFDTRASQAAVKREYGLYDPQLLLDFATGESNSKLILRILTRIITVGSISLIFLATWFMS